MATYSVQIVLATYNGERFLREQLDSLFAQTFREFSILVRDDGSTDNTLQIIEEYQQKFPGKITILKDDLKNVGAAQNFGILLENATADYLFFCDQDDKWLPDKISLSLKRIQALEAVNHTIPCLVFSDMKAMNESGTIVAESVWQQLYLDPSYFTFNRLLVQNIPHGCTMVINKAMRDLACPLPKEAILHDHWIALLAVSCGKWDFISTPTLLLRDHAENVTRKKNSLADKLKRFSANFLSKDEYEYFIKIRVNQAKALKNKIASCATEQQLSLLDDFISLENIRGFSRKKLFLQHKFFRTTFWHTFKMIARA